MSEGASPLLPAQLPAADTGVTYLPKPSQRPPFDVQQHKAVVSRTLAYLLVGILGASILAQYATLHLLVWHSRFDAIPTFEHLFNAWLPVIAGLASSAVTYYLTKEDK